MVCGVTLVIVQPLISISLGTQTIVISFCDVKELFIKTRNPQTTKKRYDSIWEIWQIYCVFVTWGFILHLKSQYDIIELHVFHFFITFFYSSPLLFSVRWFCRWVCKCWVWGIGSCNMTSSYCWFQCQHC